jgi:hypothetical protein
LEATTGEDASRRCVKPIADNLVSYAWIGNDPFLDMLAGESLPARRVVPQNPAPRASDRKSGGAIRLRDQQIVDAEQGRDAHSALFVLSNHFLLLFA